MENQEVKNIMTEERICVLIPSYHNEATLTDIVYSTNMVLLDILGIKVPKKM